MKVEEYLFRNKITKTEFAKNIGVSRSHFHQMLAGTKRITAETAFKIEKETGGAVTKEELRPDIFQ